MDEVKRPCQAKGHAKQNTKKELKETLNWTSSTETSSTGRTDAPSIGASDGRLSEYPRSRLGPAGGQGLNLAGE